MTFRQKALSLIQAVFHSEIFPSSPTEGYQPDKSSSHSCNGLDIGWNIRCVSLQGCYRSCFQFKLVEVCGCGEARLPPPPNAPICGPGDVEARECIKRLTDEFGGLHGGKDCVCNQPCFQKAYGVSFSASRWPADTYKIRDCSDTQERCVAEYRKNGVLLEIFYEQLNYEKLSESEAYGWVNLLADFGGQLGLWLGVSVLTCFEFVMLIFDFSRMLWNYDRDYEEEQRRSSLANPLIHRQPVHPPSISPISIRKSSPVKEEDEDDDDNAPWKFWAGVDMYKDEELEGGNEWDDEGTTGDDVQYSNTLRNNI